MIRTLFALLFFVTLSLGAEAAAPASSSSAAKPAKPASLVKWMDYNAAFEQAQKDPKLVFVDLYADWCIPCRVMDKNVYSDPIIARLLNTLFYPVKLDVDSQDTIMCDGQRKTVQRCYFDVWELNALPAFVLMAPKGMTILTVTDSMSPQEMQDLIAQFLRKEKEWISR